MGNGTKGRGLMGMAIALAMMGAQAFTRANESVQNFDDAVKTRLRFNQLFGSNPRSLNGGRKSGAASAKRASVKRRNIAKRKRHA